MYGRKPCNQDQVAQLAKPVHDKGFDIYLNRPDGSLRCMTRSGIPCTDAQAHAVQAVARTLGTN